MTDLLQTQQSAAKSPAVVVRSVDLKEKISLLDQNVESLLNQDLKINREIEGVKSNVESVKNGLSKQIQQINVCLKNGIVTYR